MRTEISNKIVTINPAIEFDCVVNGHELTATVTHTEDDFIQTLYHVRFSDGHMDRYAPGDTGVDEEFGRTRNLDAYEEAIWDDLAVIPGLEDGGGYTYIRVYLKKDNSGFNVWVRPGDEAGKYHVFYRGEYQFSLRRTDRWEVSTMREKGYVIDQELAALVSRKLDELQALN